MFTDVSHWLRHNPPARHYGVAVCDFDADGQSEFLVAGYGAPNRVLRWDGSQLWDIAPKSVADPDRATMAIIAADFDGDGREELYLQNSDTFAGTKSSADRLLDLDPKTGLWSDLFLRAVNKPARNFFSTRSVAAIDRRGTGRYGFAVGNYARPFSLFEQSADGHIFDVAASLGLNQLLHARGLWVGPLLSERSDLLCWNEHGPNLVFRNSGRGAFREMAKELNLDDPGEHARGLAILDANNDGALDVAWGNWDGLHRLMIRQPDGRFKNEATAAMAMPSSVRSVVAADFDNDGYEELFFNNLGEPNRLFHQINGEWRLAAAQDATLAYGSGTGAAVADVDGDGVLELLIGHGETAEQPLALFKVARADHHWLRVAPTTRFGAPARGALVKLVAGGRTQVRVVCGGSGYLCQMEPIAHFGLGPVSEVDQVRVQWPDGECLTIDHPAIRQVLHVPYPSNRFRW